ncbi:patatin-like phospholipase family protein [Ruania halotolerans]|uniref:patatin-like phospholipase family protein n=1 Tax=Ruania halotolerans TaxID=2897773 RepID=UPI001E5C85E1|nr:patatin-like phospholipase family protein [Ruania halotolerans]UFU06941.1 patatin-like phospholipase family protein [Ruania halotolerans]
MSVSRGLVRRIRHRLIHTLGGHVMPEPPPPPQEVVGLAIAGGGARSSFEIGAIDYLYTREHITPSVITGTSAGAILAAVIAQYPDRAGQQAAVAELRRLWRSMQDASDMFTELPWFTKLNEHMPTWRKVMALRHRDARAAMMSGADHTDRNGPHRSLGRPVRASTAKISRDEFGKNAGKQRQRPPDAGDPTPPEHSSGWSVANVFDTLSTLWEAGRTSTDVDLILGGAQTERAAFTPGPLVNRLTHPDLFSSQRAAASGVHLRIAAVALESGELRYITETGEIRDRLDQPVPGEPTVDLVTAIMASCAIPSVFAPVRLGSEHYVDGGARESLPVEVAVDHLGVTRCYAVVASPAGLSPATSFAEKDMLEIVMRAGFGVMTDEIQADEVRRARAAGAIVIQPELDIHDILTVDPGLVRISMDYGWIRAAEVCTEADEQQRAATREIIALRRQIWQAENAHLRPESPDAGPDAPALAHLKERLRDAVLAADPTLLPPQADGWWRDWEGHPYEVPAPTWLP